MGAIIVYVLKLGSLRLRLLGTHAQRMADKEAVS